MGQVAFVAKVDSSITADGLLDTAVYRFNQGSLSLVARSGMVIPGVGDMLQIQPLDEYGSPWPFGGAVIDARGDVLLQAITGLGYFGLNLLEASPTP